MLEVTGVRERLHVATMVEHGDAGIVRVAGHDNHPPATANAGRRYAPLPRDEVVRRVRLETAAPGHSLHGITVSTRVPACVL